MVTTRSKMSWLDDTLAHVLTNILMFKEGSDPYRAIEAAGLTEVVDLIGLEDGDVEALMVPAKEDDDGESTLLIAHQRKLKQLSHFAAYLAEENNVDVPEEEHWLSATKEMFSMFRMKEKLRGVKPTPFQVSNSTNIEKQSHDLPLTVDVAKMKDKDVEHSSASNSSSSVSTDMMLFRKSIKRDLKDYPAFKEDRHWDSFQRQVTAIGTLHEVSNVFDPDYTPDSVEATTLFDFQQKFVYTVLLKQVQTAVGRNIIRGHKDGDAQGAWKALVTHYTNSPESQIDAQTLRAKIFNLRCDESWNGTLHGFLTHYAAQVQLLESVTDTALHQTDEQKRLALESVVQGVPTLHQVAVNDRGDVARGKDPLSYTQYMQLLQHAAYEHDTANKRTKSSRRAVNQLHSSSVSGGSSQTNNHYGNGGSGASRNKSSFPSIPSDVWREMDQGLQSEVNKAKSAFHNGNSVMLPRLPARLWSKLPRDTQSHIRKFNKGKSGSHGKGKRSGGTRTVNAASVAVHNTTLDAGSPTVATGTGVATTTSTPTLRDIMSTSRTVSNASANASTSNPPNLADLMCQDADGRWVLRISHYSVVYSVARHETRRTKGSLVDSGAN